VGIDAAETTRFASEFAIPRTYDSIAALLRDEPRVELLVVATPDDVHAEAVRTAFDAGVAVYCEKPLANSVDEADELARRAVATPVPATVGFSFRYSDAVQRLRAALSAGTLGAPWFVEMHEQNTQFHPQVGRRRTWKQDPAHAPGGALFEYGAHLLDLAAWLFGPTIDVVAGLAAVTPGAGLDDIAALQLRYPRDILATAVASWVLPGGFPGIRLTVHGSDATAEVRLDDSGGAGESFRITAADGTVVADVEFRPIDRHTYAARHLDDLLALIRREDPRYPQTLPTVPEAAHVQRVLDAALAGTQRRTAISAPDR
jgi:predicted dehydrogenase